MPPVSSAFSVVVVWLIGENVSFENVLVFSGENDVKTLVWAKIFCYVFVQMKTETFENVLVWSGP